MTTTDYIYLDHAATTPLDADVFAAMQPYFTELYGNPTSIYSFGQMSRAAIDTARVEVATVLSADPMDIVFTSGGTESSNLAIKGIAGAKKKGHIVTTNIEHHATLEPCAELAQRGFDITYVPVQPDGIVRVADIEAALRDDTILVSVQYANNEIGTIQPVRDIGKLCRTRGIYFHIDAVQAPGLLPLDVRHLYVDLMSLSAHKFYGPKGSGCLFMRHGVQIMPQMTGGGQEHRLRSSTENVAGIVGLGKALVQAESLRATEVPRLTKLRDDFIAALLREIPHTRLNGHATERLANNVNVLIEGLEGEPMLLRLDFERILASAGSACTSGSMEPSHVITALGIERHDATGALRFSLGRGTTEAHLRATMPILHRVVQDLRAMAA